jgi:hypothetical protein
MRAKKPQSTSVIPSYRKDFMSYREEAPRRLPSLAWLAVLILGAAMATYGTFVVLNLLGLR